MAKLSVLYVVRNEETFIKKSLDSVVAIADEIVVVDSGSRDKTTAIARQCPKVRLFAHAWIHDFSKTKNYGIRQCTGDFILALDADELLDPKSAASLRDAAEHARGNVSAFALHIVDHPDTWDPNAPCNESSYFPSPQVRLFRKHDAIIFEGRVGESVFNSSQKCGAIDVLDASIHHFLWRGKGDEFKASRLHYYSKLGSGIPVPVTPQPPPVTPSQAAIVIPAFNALELTKDCVASVQANTKSNYVFCFADDGSVDGTANYMCEVAGKDPVRFQSNSGVAKAKNAGAKEALANPSVKFVCFLDNDAKVPEGWLEGMAEILDKNEKIAMIGPLSLTADGPQRFDGGDLKGRVPEFILADSIGGFCMLAKADILRKVGLFDEGFGPYGSEADDLCERVRQAGYDIAVANRVCVEHRGKGTVMANRLDWNRLSTQAGIHFAKKWKEKRAAPLGPRSPFPQVPPPIKPLASIVILGYNRLDMTRACIDSILAATPQPFELVFVDNGSQDGSPDWVQAKLPTAKVIRNKENVGIPKGRNQGIKATTADLIVVMDNDVEVRQGWLDDLIAETRNADAAGIEAWQIDRNFNASWKCVRQGERFDYIGGACTIFKRKVFEVAGLLDEGFEKAYYEDSISGDRCIPIKTKSGIDVIPLKELFESGTKTVRPDNKEESIVDAMTLSVDPEMPSPPLDAKNLPDWWLKFNLSEKERKIYEMAKTGKNPLYGGYVKHRIKKRIKRARCEDAQGIWKPIIKVIRHKTSKPLIRIGSKYGQTCCTTDHSIMTWNDGRLEETVPVNLRRPCSINMPVFSEETSECFLPISGGIEDSGVLRFKNCNGDDYHCPTKILYGDITARQIFRFLGAFVAEGYVGKVGLKITRAGVSVCDKDFAEQIATDARIFFGREFKIREYKEKEREMQIRGVKFKRKKEMVYVISIGNRPIAEMIADLCGIGAYHKKIPPFVFTAPIHLKRAFLDGLLKGDAFIYNTVSKSCNAYADTYKQDAFRFGSASLRLVSGVCLLLATMGKRFSVRYSDKKKEYGVDFVQFRRNAKASPIHLDPMPATDYVYDVEVKDFHTFVDAMGLLVVHNTDLCTRARQAGFKLAWSQTQKINHKQHATLLHGQKDFVWQEAMQKSQIRFAAKMRKEIVSTPEMLLPLSAMPSLPNPPIPGPESAPIAIKKLRILYLGMAYDYGEPGRGSSFEQANFLPSLRQWGRTGNFEHFDYVQIGQQHGIRRMSEMLLEKVQQFCPDALFAVWFDPNHDPQREVLKRIGQTTPCKTIGWFCDSHYRYDSFDKPWAPFLDFCVTTSEVALRRYQHDGFGKKAIKSQWGASPAYSRLLLPLDIAVSFVGQPHGDRKAVIAHLNRAGIRVQTYGIGWGQRLSHGEMVSVFNRSKINLNLSNGADASFKQIKGRNFEVPACGGFLLTGLAENLGEYYKPGVEVETYNNVEEMVAKIRHYLAHEEDRKQISEAGYQRTMRDHTYFQRYDAIFNAAGLI